MDCYWKHMIRCLFSLLIDHKLYLIPFVVFALIICDTGARALSAVIECCIVLSLSHDIVLAFWLASHLQPLYWLVGLYFISQSTWWAPLSWLVYLVILLCILNLLLWTLSLQGCWPWCSCLVHTCPFSWASWCHGGMWYSCWWGVWGCLDSPLG